MRTTYLGRAIMAVLALIAALLVSQPTSASAIESTRIMPLGDSITGSPGCWRATLWNDLQDAGYRNIDFVGTLGPQGCGVAHDGDNEGHGGILATNMAAQNQLPAWLSATAPDIVLMHLGTNDVWSNRSPDAILAAFDTLHDQMRASNPDITLLVAQIIPMNPSTCGECAQRAVALNERIPAWAQARSTAASPVIVVDQWTGFDTATDTYDGVHPNAAGDAKMAGRWFEPLTAFLSPVTDPGEPGGPEEPVVHGSCKAVSRVVGSWNGGWQGEVTVTSNGTEPIIGWSVTLTLPSGARITQVWGGSLDSATGVVSHASWNGSLDPGETATFGFIGAAPAGTTAAAEVSCSALPA